MRFSFLIPLFLISCGKEYGFGKRMVEPNVPAHDSFFDPYLRNIEISFKKATGKDYSFNVPVVFGELDDAYNGMCYSYDDPKYNYIVLNKKVFVSEEGDVFKDDLEQVLTHELGHCYFNREHKLVLVKKSDLVYIWLDNPQTGYMAKEDLYGQSVLLTPKSVMWPIYIMNSIYKNNKDYYLKEIINEKIVMSNAIEEYTYDESNLPRYSNNTEYTVYRRSTESIELRTLNYRDFIEKLYGIVNKESLKLNENEEYFEYQDHVHSPQ